MVNLIDIITQELRLRNYSPKTIKAYTFVARDLYAYFKKPLGNLSEQEVKKYLLNKQDKKLASQTIALCANAINFIFCEKFIKEIILRKSDILKKAKNCQ